MKNKLIIIAVLLFVLIVAKGVFLVHYFSKDLPSIEELQYYKPNLTTKIYDMHGELIDELFIERRIFLAFDQIPENLIDAIVATEDKRYYRHWGIDPIGIVRAILKKLLTGKRLSATSTITQQLARNLFLTLDRSYIRKIKEAILAIKLEQQYSKNEILGMYFNHIYFGHGVYGINMAADLYFGKHPNALNLEECALIAGLPKAPSYYSPFKYPESALKRRNTVLRRMYDEKFITQEHYEISKSTPIITIEKNIEEKYASYFVEYVRQELESLYGEMLYRGGLQIYTTIDLNMQIAAVNALKKHLEKFDVLKLRKIKEHLEHPQKKLSKWDKDILIYDSTDTYKNVQGSIIALDTKNGQIRALVGGRDFKDSQFNRAIQARRQPGSCFKPIIFTAAIDQGLASNIILKDEPVIYYNDGTDWELVGNTTDYSDVDPEIISGLRIIEEDEDKNGDEASLIAKHKIINVDEEDKEEVKYDPMQIWRPGNYSNKYKGDVTLRTSLQKSINVTSIKLLEKAGTSTACYYAKKLGIKSYVAPYLSMALGTFVVTPLELTNAYATIANRGVKTKPYAIIKIYDNDGQLLEQRYPEEEEVLSEETAFIMSHLLHGVVEYGTGRYARRLRRPTGGKTGTTNNYSDAWFIGFTPQIVASVWVGFDDQRTLGKGRTGGRLACPIWTDFMKKALKEKPKIDFDIPDNIVFVPINKNTGLRSIELDENSYMEAFIQGTEPEEVSMYSELFNNYDDIKEIEEIDDEEIFDISKLEQVVFSSSSIDQSIVKSSRSL
ncbi:MAG: hypothetical protein GY817_01790 [bacterium]|nr:hypothetical protein [bacterium]